MWILDGIDQSDKKLTDSLSRLFSTVHTGSVSIGADAPLSFTAYFAHEKNDIWLTSKPSTAHVQAIGDKVSAAAVCIWQQPLEWGAPLFGLQLTGTIEVVKEKSTAEKGLRVLHNRFPGTMETIPIADLLLGENQITCLLRIVCNKGKFRDEWWFPKGMHKITWKQS